MRYRKDRLEELLKREVSDYILKRLDLRDEKSLSADDKKIFLTITRVEASEDLDHFKFFYLVYPDSAAAIAKKKLDADKNKIKQHIIKKFNRVIRDILFEFDKGMISSYRVEEILK